MLQSTSRRHENTGKMWSHIKKRTDSKINLFSFAIMLVLLRSLFPSHDLLKLSSTQFYPVFCSCSLLVQLTGAEQLRKGGPVGL